MSALAGMKTVRQRCPALSILCKLYAQFSTPIDLYFYFDIKQSNVQFLGVSMRIWSYLFDKNLIFSFDCYLHDHFCYFCSCFHNPQNPEMICSFFHTRAQLHSTSASIQLTIQCHLQHIWQETFDNKRNSCKLYPIKWALQLLIYTVSST